MKRVPTYLHFLGKVEVDDHVDVLHVEASRGHVRGHQDERPALLEIMQDAVTLGLKKSERSETSKEAGTKKNAIGKIKTRR